MSYYYTQSENKIVQLDDTLYQGWVANGNPKAGYYQRIPDPPGPGYSFNGTQWVAPPTYVPQQVTAFQARAALLQAGLLSQVEAAVASSDDMTKLAWNHALHFERYSGLLQSMATQLGLTEQQLDNLFIAGSQIIA